MGDPLMVIEQRCVAKTYRAQHLVGSGIYTRSRLGDVSFVNIFIGSPRSILLIRLTSCSLVHRSGILSPKWPTLAHPMLDPAACRL